MLIFTFPSFADFEIPTSKISLSFLLETFLIPENNDSAIFDGIMEHGFLVEVPST